MLIRSLKIQGMLSFRDATLELRPLNVLIGPNASGKSNLIEVMALLQAAPRDLSGFIRRSGGIGDWLWKGEDSDGGATLVGSVEAVLDNPSGAMPVRYVLRLDGRGQRFAIAEELLENVRPHSGHEDPYFYFRTANGYGSVTTWLEEERARPLPINPENLPDGQSVLHERKDPAQYPVVTDVGRQFDSIRLYREWNLGRESGIRKAHPTDAPIDFLEESFANLALVLNQLQLGPAIMTVEQQLSRFYDMYESVHTNIQANMAQLWVREKGLTTAVPATRLSDGTLRFLSLLAILCHPNPPRLICIEEPELGLHPDILPQIAELLKSASDRTQLIVTTHSDRLFDELSDQPESVVVCERGPDFGTEFRRLSTEDLKLWLENYQLGELWKKGEIGGTRW